LWRRGQWWWKWNDANPGTPAGTYTVTITGTYGSTTHMQDVTLVVQ
jgi:hypothetical protein